MKIILISYIDENLKNGKIYSDYFEWYSDSPDLEYFISDYYERPHIKVDCFDRHLKNEIHQWLVSISCDYSLFFEGDIYDQENTAVWGIDILDNRLATLFKLTWC